MAVSLPQLSFLFQCLSLIARHKGRKFPEVLCVCACVVCVCCSVAVYHFTSSLTESLHSLLIHTHTHTLSQQQSLVWTHFAEGESPGNKKHRSQFPFGFFLKLSSPSGPVQLVSLSLLGDLCWGFSQPGRHAPIARRSRTAAIIPLSRDRRCRSAPRCAQGSNRPYRLTRSENHSAPKSHWRLFSPSICSEGRYNPI